MTVRTTACPGCGTVATREPYEIGSGPELACASCEWCWGADGQDLTPLDGAAIIAGARIALAKVHEQREAGS